MQHSHYLWASLLSLGLVSPAFAESTDSVTVTAESSEESTAVKHSRLEALKELKNVKAKDLKVDAHAAQPEEENRILHSCRRLHRELHSAYGKVPPDCVRR